jgi:hypothetical protein
MRTFLRHNEKFSCKGIIITKAFKELIDLSCCQHVTRIIMSISLFSSRVQLRWSPQNVW